MEPTSNAEDTLSQSDREQLDKAATCMVSTSRQSLCAEPHEELFCRVFCCANANPFYRQDKECRQLCANTLLKHYRQASSDESTMGRGKVGEFLFANSQTYTMKDPAGTKLLAGSNLPCRDWTPDICMYDKNHTLALIYDMKFKNDRWHEGQFEAYKKLVRGKKNKVMELNETSCKCADRDIKDESNKNTPVTQEELNKNLKNMNESINAEFNK